MVLVVLCVCVCVCVCVGGGVVVVYIYCVLVIILPCFVVFKLDVVIEFLFVVFVYSCVTFF